LIKKFKNKKKSRHDYYQKLLKVKGKCTSGKEYIANFSRKEKYEKN